MVAVEIAAGFDPAIGGEPVHAVKTELRSRVSSGASIGQTGEIRIIRRMGGARLAHSVPRKRIGGLVLALGEPNRPCELRLAFVSGGSLFLRHVEDHEAVAVWRALASKLGLTMLLRREDGSKVAIEQKIGAVQRGPAGQARRRRALRGRRPRFLIRRKATVMPKSPAIHSGRELTATR